MFVEFVLEVENRPIFINASKIYYVFEGPNEDGKCRIALSEHESFTVKSLYEDVCLKIHEALKCQTK